MIEIFSSCLSNPTDIIIYGPAEHFQHNLSREGEHLMENLKEFSSFGGFDLPGLEFLIIIVLLKNSKKPQFFKNWLNTAIEIEFFFR